MKNADRTMWIGLAGVTAVGAWALQRSVRDVGHTVAADRPTPRPAAASRRFDPLFREWGKRRSIPPAYLRALGVRESDLNPRQQEGTAWGLLQVRLIVVDDFNRRHGTTWKHIDVLDAERNVEISSWLLRTIADSYAKNHPDVPNLLEDWTNPRFVELLTFGWNAGWSESRGVGRVARALEAQGRHADITIDQVHAHARQVPGVATTLARAAKVRWCKSVARLYMSERLRELNDPKAIA